MAAFAAKGTLLQIGDGATPSEGFTTIAEVQSFDGLSLTAETLETTTLGDAYKTYISAGLYDGGEFSFEGTLAPTDTEQARLVADLKAGTQRNFQLVLSDTTTSTYSFAAIVTKFAFKGETAGLLTFSASLRLIGTYTMA